MAYKLKDHVKLLSSAILNRERRCILNIQSDIDKRQQREIKETLYERQADVNEAFKYEKIKVHRKKQVLESTMHKERGLVLVQVGNFCQVPKWGITVSHPQIWPNFQAVFTIFDKHSSESRSWLRTVLLNAHKSQRRFYSQCPTIQFQGRALLLHTQKGDVLFTIAGHYIV